MAASVEAEAAKAPCFSKALLRMCCVPSPRQGRLAIRLPACSNKKKGLLAKSGGFSWKLGTAGLHGTCRWQLGSH